LTASRGGARTGQADGDDGAGVRPEGERGIGAGRIGGVR